MNTELRTAKDDHATSISLSKEELRQIDAVTAQARAIDPHHPLRYRSTVLKYALQHFATNGRAVQEALSGGDV